MEIIGAILYTVYNIRTQVDPVLRKFTVMWPTTFMECSICKIDKYSETRSWSFDDDSMKIVRCAI